ncbi:MAG: flagellar basal body rod protein FlgC [Burkholderiaceae bacterium]|nr:flagellar basal body rod protein FlgC [Burkholderiaceae bacterium]
MSLFSIFNVASSAMAAQSQRLNTVASNIANAESATGPGGQPYRARHVVFAAQPVDAAGSAGVQVTSVVEDPSAPRMVYDPKHPMANEGGYVAMPNVNPVDEMVNMISASRAYQNNVETLNTAKTLLQKTLSIGQ